MSERRPWRKLITALWAASPRPVEVTDSTQFAFNGSTVSRAEFFTQGVDALRSAMPNLHVRVRDSICTETRCALRITATGTHAGTLFGVEPTGTEVTLPGTLWLDWEPQPAGASEPTTANPVDRLRQLRLYWNRGSLPQVLGHARERLEASAVARRSPPP